MKRRNVLITLGVLLVIGLCASPILLVRAGVIEIPTGPPGAAGLQQTLSEDSETVEVIIGDLSSSATATGQFLPQDEASLSLGITGEVLEVFVREGSVVEAGDPLLRIDTAALERNVATAEQNLIIQQANLDSLMQGSNAEDIAAAEAALESAKASLEDLKEGPSDPEILAQEASIRSAEASLNAAQVQLRTAQESASATEISAAEASVRAANSQLNASYAQLQDLQGGPDSADIASAEASLKSAEANVASALNQLESLKEGPTAAAISSAQSNIDSAQASVANAQQALENVKAGPSEAQISQAEVSLISAQQQQKAAQDAYDHAFTCYEQDDGYVACPNEPLQESAATNLQIANQNLAAAQATLADLLAGPSQEDIWAAQSSLNAAIAQRDSAQKNLDNLYIGATDTALAAAQQSYTSAIAQRESARANLQRVREGASDGDVQNATASVNNAVASRDNALAQLETLREGPNANSVASARAQIVSAQAQVNSAEANFDVFLQATSAASIAQAESAVAQAEATLANLMRSATDTQIAIAEAQVRQAEIQLEEARQNLANAVLTAPFAGTVSSLNVTKGEVAGGVVMNLINLETLAVTVDVDEIDLAELSVGQIAEVTFDAYPNTVFNATVASIASTPNSNTGSEIVSYEVRLDVEQVDDVELRIGMTANADLVTASREGIILVPNRAVTADRSRGVFSVNVIRGSGEDREIETVEITTGMRDSQFTEVLDGLEVGDELLVGDFSAPTQGFGPPED